MIYRLLYRRVCTVGNCGLTCLGRALIKASKVNCDGNSSSLNNIGINKAGDLNNFTLYLLLVMCLPPVYTTSFCFKKIWSNYGGLPSSLTLKIYFCQADRNLILHLNGFFLHFKCSWLVRKVAVSSRLSLHTCTGRFWSYGTISSAVSNQRKRVNSFTFNPAADKLILHILKSVISDQSRETLGTFNCHCRCNMLERKYGLGKLANSV